VAPGDHKDHQSRAVLLRSCRADGRLLKPSYPATTLDSAVRRKAFGAAAGGPQGELYGTYSAVPLLQPPTPAAAATAATAAAAAAAAATAGESATSQRYSNRWGTAIAISMAAPHALSYQVGLRV
jgi:hypothetical protein